MLENYTFTATKIDNGKGYWGYNLVEIFDNGVKIGEYTRNYGTMYDTFVPFRQNGKDYALYSKCYTATRVMELPSCKDLGGQENNANGFCPTGYYVPYAKELEEDQRENLKSFLDQNPDESFDEWKVIGPDGTFGFICGCYWGADSSWDINFLDLSQVSEGIIGFNFDLLKAEIWTNKTLKDMVEVESYSKWEYDEGVRFFVRSDDPYRLPKKEL